MHIAVLRRQPEMVRLLIEQGADPHAGLYPHRDATSPLTVARERGYSEIVAVIEEAERARPPAAVCEEPESKDPLWRYAGSGEYEKARALLERGADPNGLVFASGSPMFQAFSQGDLKMIDLLTEFGGEPEATTAGLFRQTDLARRMLEGETAYRLDGVGGDTLAEQLLWGGACGGDPEIVRMALERVDWLRDDVRWFTILEQALRIWRYGSVAETWDRRTYPVCFGMVLKRCDPNLTARFGITILHSVAGSRRHVTAEERVAFATMLLDVGARVDIRDDLLGKTAVEWAARWERGELLELFASR